MKTIYYEDYQKLCKGGWENLGTIDEIKNDVNVLEKYNTIKKYYFYDIGEIIYMAK